MKNKKIIESGWSRACLLAFALLSSTLAVADTRDFTLYVEPGTLTINGAGGASMTAWGYTSSQGGSPVFPAPQLAVSEGDLVNITLVNDHTRNHNLVVKGLSEADQTAVAPGQSHTYSFQASQAGTYLYFDGLNSGVNREMGLYGAFVVTPADGSSRAWTNGPAYDLQRTWVIGEMDKSRWNDVAGVGGSVDTGDYRPNYFVINGQGGFDAMHDPSTVLAGTVGDSVLVRIVNGGQLFHSLHFHGAHIRIVADDGTPRSEFREATTVNVPARSSVDVIYDMTQPGTYPMHVHTAQMETANGVYLNGVATMIEIQ